MEVAKSKLEDVRPGGFNPLEIFGGVPGIVATEVLKSNLRSAIDKTESNIKIAKERA